MAAVGYWTIGLSKTSKIIIASFMRNELGIAVFEIKSVKKEHMIASTPGKDLLDTVVATDGSGADSAPKR